ncbi:MAG TPA: RNA polymerase sigma factor RpoE [Gammaproteobacteria bacterium]|nr:RNA polymerase sigma factor RpoE [Gammaproteobacteria bacterium]
MGKSSADLELVERVQHGDKKAFDILVLKYQHKVIKLISRYLHEPNEILDVAQEAMIKAYRGLPNFRGESAFYTWLYRIVINTVKNYVVAQGRRPLEADSTTLSDGEPLVDEPNLKENATPERLLLRDEIEKTVFDVIEELPEDLRTAITLRELEGLSYEEIAQAMSCPIGTVRSRIFRAREAINNKLKPLLEEGQ